MGDVKLNKNKCQSGMDGIQTEFTLTVKGTDTLTIDEEILKNGDNKKIGIIKCHKGKVSDYIENAKTRQIKRILKKSLLHA